MSDFNEIVKRVTTDRSFRNDLLKDVKGTLAAHNYRCTSEEVTELGKLTESNLDQLDEALMDQVVGGATLSTSLTLSPTLTSMPLLSSSLNLLYQQNYFSGYRSGSPVAGSSTW